MQTEHENIRKAYSIHCLQRGSRAPRRNQVPPKKFGHPRSQKRPGPLQRIFRSISSKLTKLVNIVNKKNTADVSFSMPSYCLPATLLKCEFLHIFVLITSVSFTKQIIKEKLPLAVSVITIKLFANSCIRLWFQLFKVNT